jgi:hypothetical protein
MSEDNFDEVIATVEAAGDVVIGSPVEGMGETLMQNVTVGIERFQCLAEEAEAATKEVDALVQAAIDSAPEEIRERILFLRREQANLSAQQAAVADQVKMGVSAVGKTVKHGRVTAVYTEGRESADIAMLKGMAAFYPAISQALKKGQPSVSIRLK